MFERSGSQIVTADAILGGASRLTTVRAIHIISGATPGIVILRNGSSGSGTAVIQQTGTANTGATFEYGDGGFSFPDGCFVDIDANVVSVYVAFVQ